MKGSDLYGIIVWLFCVDGFEFVALRDFGPTRIPCDRDSSKANRLGKFNVNISGMDSFLTRTTSFLCTTNDPHFWLVHC